MNTPRFWPLDFDPEGEIYENVAWDLPGYKRGRQPRPAAQPPRRKKSRRE
jgi:hypothetical protein